MREARCSLSLGEVASQTANESAHLVDAEFASDGQVLIAVNPEIVGLDVSAIAWNGGNQPIAHQEVATGGRSVRSDSADALKVALGEVACMAPGVDEAIAFDESELGVVRVPRTRLRIGAEERRIVGIPGPSLSKGVARLQDLLLTELRKLASLAVVLASRASAERTEAVGTFGGRHWVLIARISKILPVRLAPLRIAGSTFLAGVLVAASGATVREGGRLLTRVDGKAAIVAGPLGADCLLASAGVGAAPHDPDTGVARLGHSSQVEHHQRGRNEGEKIRQHSRRYELAGIRRVEMGEGWWVLGLSKISTGRVRLGGLLIPISLRLS